MADPGAGQPAWAPPAWAWPATVSLGLIGLGISAYLTLVHYSTSVTLACTSNGTINCEKVTSSPQSELLGLPVALWGSAYFVVLIAFCTPWAWASAAPAIRLVRIGLAIAGVGMVLRLIYAELFEIDAICLWCTAVHIVMVALFGAVVIATAVAQVPHRESGPRIG